MKNRVRNNNRSVKYVDKCNNDEYDEEEEEERTINKYVFRERNHIYFRCDVTMISINTLCNLIEECNREHEMLQSELTSVIVIPKPIYLHLTSVGGDMLGGFMAFDYIKNSKVPIYTVAEGYAVSSAANMFMAGQKRFMTENSYILIHQLSANKCGRETFHDTIDDASNSIEFMSKLYGIFLNNVRYNRKEVLPEDILTKKDLENHMLHDVYWNYETCYRYGLVDELYTNYNDIDVKDVQQYIKNGLTSARSEKPTKIYSIEELRPSEEVINKLKKANEKSSDMMEIIKKHIARNLTTKSKRGLVNDADNSSIDDSEVQIPKSKRRKTRRTKY